MTRRVSIKRLYVYAILLILTAWEVAVEGGNLDVRGGGHTNSAI